MGTTRPAALAALALSTLLLPLLTVVGTAPARAQEDGRPNIVLIVTDDMDTSLLTQMPYVQRELVQQGTSFENFFVAAPICCPSRASILRGQYVHNHRVIYNLPPSGFVDFHRSGRERSTVATWLRRDGYRTALVGKYMTDYRRGVPETYIPPGWDRWVTAIKGKYVDYDLNLDGKIVHFGSRAREYQVDVEWRYAKDFIGRPGDAPFFLYLAPRAPHKPAIPAPRHRNANVDGRLPRTEAFAEKDVADKPRWVRAWPTLEPRRIASLERLQRQRIRSLLAVDDLVADLVTALETRGELDNTYIFFTSDNGWLMGQHHLLGKGAPYEESIRVPLVVRGPGVPAAATVRELTSNIDLAPTIVALAGAQDKVSSSVDGRSLVPFLSGGPSPDPWREAILVEYSARRYEVMSDRDDVAADGIRGSTPPPSYRALRTATHVYVEYAIGEDKREFYDLVEDPQQLTNLIRSAPPGQEDEVKARADFYAAWLETLKRCQAAACHAAENAPPAPPPPGLNGT